MINQSNFWYCLEFLYMRILLGCGNVCGDDWGALSVWQVAKDLGLISMGMSRCGACDVGLAGAGAAVAQPVPARPARRAIVSAFELHRRASAAALRRGLAFAMTSQAGGT
jgi:hypothetical protein